MASATKKNIVIVGGGVIGCTTAYFLTRHPKFNPTEYSITLLEASSIAAGASGKAGGLLALWAYPQCLVPLSFRLHAELAKEHGGAQRWGYRRVNCGSISAVVTDADLKRINAAQKRPPNGNSTGDHAALNSSQAGPGTEESLPIQSALGSTDDDKSEEWQKLPKQDEAAAELLEEAVLPKDLDWIDQTVVEDYESMGQPGFTDTAQVHPFHFTTAISQLAAQAGVDIRVMAMVTRINSTEAGVQSVEYKDRQTGETHHIGDLAHVIVAAGPWTGRVLPKTQVKGIRAHSVVYEADVSPYAVFTNIDLPSTFVPEHRMRRGQKRKHKSTADPEIYARPFNEVYACGETDKSVPLPDTADQVQCDEARVDDLTAYIRLISPDVLGAAPIKARQACYLPQHNFDIKSQGPIVGPTSVRGLWVASGHTCWGIQNAPATGFLVAELVMDGRAASADIRELSPRNFDI